jgi:hypothetical protein
MKGRLPYSQENMEASINTTQEGLGTTMEACQQVIRVTIRASEEKMDAMVNVIDQDLRMEGVLASVD